MSLQQDPGPGQAYAPDLSVNPAHHLLTLNAQQELDIKAPEAQSVLLR